MLCSCCLHFLVFALQCTKYLCHTVNSKEKTTENLMLHLQHCWPPWSVKDTGKNHTGNPERQEKLADDVKRMLFPRTLVWPSNRKPLSDTTFNHILFRSHVLYIQLKVIISGSFSHLISTKTKSTAHRGLPFKHKSCSAESEWLLYFTMTIQKGLN